MSSKFEIKNNHNTTYPAILPSRPELSTKGKNALIAGGGSGIGATLADSLARSGISNLALLGRNENSLAETKRNIESSNPGTKVWVYAVDLLDAKKLQASVQSFAVGIDGKIDVLVANAGYMSDLDSITDSDPEEWWKGFEINIRGNFNLLQAFQPHASPKASVIHVSTIAIHSSYMSNYSSYRASKLGAYKLFEYYHRENPDFFVLQFHPGVYCTPGMGPKFIEDMTKYNLTYDDPVLAGDFLVWALSEEAKFLNGRFVNANWDVDELMSKKAELEADRDLLTMQLSV